MGTHLDGGLNFVSTASSQVDGGYHLMSTVGVKSFKPGHRSMFNCNHFSGSQLAQMLFIGLACQPHLATSTNAESSAQEFNF